MVATFTKELEEEIESQGGWSQASKFDHPDPLTKDQVESKGKAVEGASASDLEGCIQISSDLVSSGDFDNNITIKFTPLLLNSPKVLNPKFLDQSKNPQSQPSQLGTAFEVIALSNQGQPSNSKKA